MTSLCESSGTDKSIMEELIPKKVRFRGEDNDTNSDMMVDSPSEKPISWKDKLIGSQSKDSFNKSEGEDFEILEGDVQKTLVNGVPAITFSDRIQQILIQGMENTVVLKLLGRNIGFSVLQNKIYNLWRPSKPMHLMDIENGYFLVKFQNKVDYERVLSEGPWIIFGQYLTVQPWTLGFDPFQAFPSVVMAWIRFPSLPGYLYNHKIITEIGGMVGKVVKLDMNTDNRARGRFARMAVYIDLEKPLVLHLLINGRKQTVEYESLPTICFHCVRYGHTEIFCAFRNSIPTRQETIDLPGSSSKVQTRVVDESVKSSEMYGPWMIVERKSRRKFRENGYISAENQEGRKEGSRFRILTTRDSHEEISEKILPDTRKNRGKDLVIGKPQKSNIGVKLNGQPVLKKNKPQ
ncbi:hypothetical protein J1N35_011760 [Gossypium stocksii]|uniref:DUF4283 domain-containing protein n=1 Tax=Gossypium stocksii TaxID=47602 RepID=A0A9D3W3C1_9ROSI|nr:hypothetical protein J1N35_011760 [Gossypium stocksii]